MIDIHIHCLPGIDDGARSLAEAVEMCRLAASEGCEALVATPHQRHAAWRNLDREALRLLIEELRARAGEQPRLYPGGEIRVDEELLDELDEVGRSRGLAGHGALPLAGSRYLLLELDRGGFGPDPAELVGDVVAAGWRPILAHPEFIAPLADDPGFVAELVARGATCQITAMSLTGDFGPRAERRVRRFLDAGLVHFVASDAHGLERRPPGLARAHAELIAGWGREVADALTTGHPRAVLADLALGEEPRQEAAAQET